MPELVVMGAMLKCSFGVAPTTLIVARKAIVMATMKPAANINDSKIANVPTFGMCQTQSNPAVAAATAAALGTPTPAPCVPNLTAPWSPGASIVKVEGAPALTKPCVLNCSYGGVIEIKNAGQTKVQAK
jgi:hypothetical protein